MVCRFTVFGFLFLACQHSANADEADEPLRLILQLGDARFSVREDATRALTESPKYAPWVRRATRDPNPEISSRARDVTAAYRIARQSGIPGAIRVTSRAEQPDLFLEWFLAWRTEKANDLWPPGFYFAQHAAMTHTKLVPRAGMVALNTVLAQQASRLDDPKLGPVALHDGPWEPLGSDPAVLVRTDRIDNQRAPIIFAAARGQIRTRDIVRGTFFTQDAFSCQEAITFSLVICDSSPWYMEPGRRIGGPLSVLDSLIICRGNYSGPIVNIAGSVILVGGDADLSETDTIENSTILVRGKVKMAKKPVLKNAKIEENVPDALAPFKFFELADVGVEVATPEKDRKGVPVAAVRAETPFAAGGVTKGDTIVAIDDEPVTTPDEFRKQVRKAMVVQGDCLLTVSRGGKTLDLVVRFPLPK